MADALTIGELASLLDVTAKTIRHYHKKGLLCEPPRDGSGYRRYSSRDVLRLVQVRLLASAGVSLADIPDLLNQSQESFGASVEDIDQDLTLRIQLLTERRDKLRQLRRTGLSGLPERAQEMLQELQRLGFDPDFVSVQRDAMKLTAALAPEILDDYIPQMQSRLADPQHTELLKRLWLASSWGPQDPRLDSLAEEMARNLLANPEHLQHHPTNEPIAENARIYRLINHFAELPSASVLTQKIESHLRRAGLDIPRA